MSDPHRPDARLPTLPEIYALRPWYHDFSDLGLRTDFEAGLSGLGGRLRGALRDLRAAAAGLEKGARHPFLAALRPGAPGHRRNQLEKQRHLQPMLHQALTVHPAPSCLELFCADGYYACAAAQSTPGCTVLGVDRDPLEIRRARAAATALDLENAAFLVDDVWRFLSTEPVFDVVLCTGGLYHLTSPESLLAALRRTVSGHLVVQSVVTLETEDPEYFVSPAPRWRHGSRFTHARLEGWLSRLGWQIQRSERGELPGNRHPWDRGSSYFLCRPPTAPIGPATSPGVTP